MAQAIKYFSKTNFKRFLNKHRINHIIEQMGNNRKNQYTIQWYYYNSEFKNQPSFNRIFKQITGNLPSEYKKMKAKSEIEKAE